jgi:broad specificity phosphatase PhoE
VELLRERLAELRFAALYSSPLRRALDTALAAPANLISSLRVLKSLAEIHCGAVEGLPIENIQRSLPDEWRRNQGQTDEFFSWPGGETYARFRRRVLRVVQRIAILHPGEDVVIVTHAGVVNQILGTLAGQSAARWENFRPGNTAITRVDWKCDSGKVICFDDRAHLRPLTAPDGIRTPEDSQPVGGGF